MNRKQPATPRLDFRDADAFYRQTLTLARQWCPDWTASWSSANDALNTRDDVGLALFRLFSDLSQYVVRQLNGVPEKNQLAFLDFMGINPRLPLPSAAPLVFQLVSLQSIAQIDAGATIASKLDREIFFQTSTTLTVLPAVIELALLIDPDQDGYSDYTDRISAEVPFSLFAAPEQQLPHLMLLGSMDLFQPGPALQELQIQLSGSNLFPQYFEKWYDGTGKPLRVKLTDNDENSLLQILFLDMPSAPALPVNQAIDAIVGVVQGITDAPQLQPALGEQASVSEYWLGATPAVGVRILPIDRGTLPSITTVKCQLGGSGIQPDGAAYNNTQLAIKDGNYPFGPTPKTDDCFYLRSDSLFPKQGAYISCYFNLRTVQPPPGQTVTAQLAWEFWDGTTWVGFNTTSNAIQLYQFVDTTSNLTQNSEKGPTLISFICPDIQPTKVAGQSGWWIRARIASGNYGSAYLAESLPLAKAILQVSNDVLSAFVKSATGQELNALQLNQLKAIFSNDLGVKQGLNFTSKFQESGYYPPFILSLSLSYNFAGPPDAFVCYNEFTATNMVSQPYTPPAERLTTLYLGFGTEGFATLAPGNELTLFFPIAQPRTSVQPPGRYLWQYYQGTDWLPLQVKDGTSGFTKPGIVAFVVPANLQPAVLFSRELCWLRILDLMPGQAQSPIVSGIYPNAVMASNAVLIQNEILGSSLGIPSQKVRFANPYVLAGQTLVVAEPANIDSALDLPEIPPKLSQTSEEERASLGRVQEAKTLEVTWEEVENFASSDPQSRHYTLEHTTGLVTFGDGVHGMIPPRGKNNLIATAYLSAKGKRGNQPANSIVVQTPPNPQILAVWNPVAASGGTAGDDNQKILYRGPEIVASYGQGLTPRDIAYLVLEASPLILKANVVADAIGPVRVALLCDMPGPAPVPDAATLSAAVEYLRPRVLATLANRILATAPEYLAIDVSGSLMASDPAEQVKERIQLALEAYLNPKTGGSDGSGWPFAATIQAAELTRRLTSVKGVLGVISLLVNSSSDFVKLAPMQLPTPGSVNFVIYAQTEASSGD